MILTTRKTKVFLKYYHFEELKLILDQYVRYAVTIQKSELNRRLE